MLRCLRIGLLTLAGVAALQPLRAASAEEEAEATRLYTWANSYVKNVTEGDYTYAYIQFYWKRAESFVERVQRVYPDSPTAKGLKSGELTLNGFNPVYFRDRVLYRLEEKHVAASDGIDCAIFLYTRDEQRWDDLRKEALVSILQNLSRQKRFSEAIRFEPVRPVDRPLRYYTIFQVAAFYEQDDLVRRMLLAAPASYQETMKAILAKAVAERGLDRKKKLLPLLAGTNSEAVRLAVLDGMVIRETAIRRAAALGLPLNLTEIETDTVKRPEVRDDVESTAKQLFPAGNPKADALLAKYQAGLGQLPSAAADLDTQKAYLDYLALSDRFPELIAYPDRGLAEPTRTEVTRYAIELLARNAHVPDAQGLVARFGPAGTRPAELAQLSLFRGEMYSSADPLIVHPDTFVDLPIKDPCLLAQAIMEWSLTPNRQTRGSSPWDAVVCYYEPGFDHIPESKSADVKKAAQSTSPF